MEGKGFELFPSNEVTERFLEADPGNELNTEDQNNLQTYLNNSFIKIYVQIRNFLSEAFVKQMIFILAFGLFFGVFVLVSYYNYSFDLVCNFVS